MKQTFNVPDMSCDHCINHIETALNQLDGVLKIKSSLRKKQVTVKFDQTIVSMDQLINQIKEAGYTAIPN
ncbi:copper-binding protein [Vagococcus penaei]|uniref:Copper chaperone CopZ n=1 Tax=Vagococcus penaei TaxID=633807 RepID=A0A1Q2D4M1_9ENTE|nr:copper ion binding protein [Vagococcus penaei]AQP53360.1 copper-binding protein [Vagococcus penaei]RSU04131.1 copper-binding protein [Vagococcus penaei]